MYHVAMGRLQSVQILRFVAAALVVLAHAYAPAKIGAIGVDVFFVISGFIITKVASNASPGTFLRDRIRRIYPIYYLASVPSVLAALALGRLTIPNAIVSLTLWPVIGSFHHPLLAVGWSLSFEMLFYLATALTIAWPKATRWLLAAYALSMLGAVATGSPALVFIGSPMVLEFLLGVTIARSGGGTPKAGLVAFVTGVVLIAAQVGSAERLSNIDAIMTTAVSLRPLLWGVPAALIVWGGLQLEPMLQGKVSRGFAYLGDASYSIYLIHFQAIAFFAALLPWQIAALLAIVVGVGVHRYIEAPLLRLLRSSRPVERRLGSV